jgi:hypothetical protein
MMMCEDIIAKIYLHRMVTLKKFTLCLILLGGGQNKNKNMIFYWLYLVHSIQHFEELKHSALFICLVIMSSHTILN